MASEFGSILARHCFEFLSQIAPVKRAIALIPKRRRLVEQPTMKVVVDTHSQSLFSDSFFCSAANCHLNAFRPIENITGAVLSGIAVFLTGSTRP
jgi:hypothetical protein